MPYRRPDFSRRVAVTGLGIISPVGQDVDTAWEALTDPDRVTVVLARSSLKSHSRRRLRSSALSPITAPQTRDDSRAPGASAGVSMTIAPDAPPVPPLPAPRALLGAA